MKWIELTFWYLVFVVFGGRTKQNKRIEDILEHVFWLFLGTLFLRIFYCE